MDLTTQAQITPITGPGPTDLAASDMAGAAARRCGPEALTRHANHPSAYLALNGETRHFTIEGIDGFIAYRPAGGFLFQLGGVFAPPAARTPLLEAFRTMARRSGRRVCAVQLRTHDLPLYQQAGFQINQFGCSYTLDLARFKTSGTRFMKTRNKIARARKAGIAVLELGVDAPRSEEAWAALQAVTASWLRTKGRRAKLLEFMIGELGESGDTRRRVFVARHQDQVIGFISYVPSYGRFAGVMHDISRRIPNAPPGVMELINVTAIHRFKSEGIDYLNFGLTPFAGLSEQTDCLPEHSPTVARLLRWLARYGSAVYPAESQVQYKLKWQPQIITPEYIAFEGRFRWACLWRLLRLTQAI